MIFTFQSSERVQFVRCHYHAKFISGGNKKSRMNSHYTYTTTTWNNRHPTWLVSFDPIDTYIGVQTGIATLQPRFGGGCPLEPWLSQKKSLIFFFVGWFQILTWWDPYITNVNKIHLGYYYYIKSHHYFSWCLH